MRGKAEAGFLVRVRHGSRDPVPSGCEGPEWQRDGKACRAFAVNRLPTMAPTPDIQHLSRGWPVFRSGRLPAACLISAA